LDTSESIPSSDEDLVHKSIDATDVMRPELGDAMAVSLLTGGFDRPYAFGLAMALTAKGMHLDVIGSDEIDSPEMHTTPKLNFLNLRGSKKEAGLIQKISRVLAFYARLGRYAANAKPKIFHILWNDKFQLFDRTLLMLCYKLLGKKVVLTVHNVNAGKRDANDSFLNRLTLKVQYRLMDHLFVHTEKMRTELFEDFGVRKEKVTVIPFGINNAAPVTNITRVEARRRLGIGASERAILFFGAIRPYKGLEYLLAAFGEVAASHTDYRLVIAGEPKHVSEEYMGELQRMIVSDTNCGHIIHRMEFIPDEETEWYFKAADVLVLPYTHVFQSGVLSLAYSFGLPVIATDVGSLKEDVIEGSTGFVCKPCDPADLARAINMYFASPLFMDLDNRREGLREYARARYSWDVVGEVSRRVYVKLLAMPTV
jgi:glycosyltransferase involved in cell wall biosynthesis